MESKKKTHKFVQTPQRTPNSFPHGQQEANGRETLFSSRQGRRVLAPRLFLALVGVRLDRQVQLRLLVVKLEFAVEPSVREVVSELHLGAVANVSAEIGPFRSATEVSLLELLRAAQKGKKVSDSEMTSKRLRIKTHVDQTTELVRLLHGILRDFATDCQLFHDLIRRGSTPLLSLLERLLDRVNLELQFFSRLALRSRVPLGSFTDR